MLTTSFPKGNGRGKNKKDDNRCKASVCNKLDLYIRVHAISCTVRAGPGAKVSYSILIWDSHILNQEGRANIKGECVRMKSVSKCK